MQRTRQYLIVALLLAPGIANAQDFTLRGQFSSGSGLGANSEFRVFGGVRPPDLKGENESFRVIAPIPFQLPDLPVISIISETGIPGHKVVIPISVDDATGLAGADFSLRYDASALTALGIQPSRLLEDGKFTFRSNLDTRGLVRVSTGGPIALPAGKGPLFHIVFAVNDEATPGDYPIAADVARITGTSGRATIANVSPGGVTIKALVRGDVDDDGQVTSSDAIQVLEFLVALAEPTTNQMAAADVNQDGEIDIGDVILIFRRAAGFIEAFTKPALLADAVLSPIDIQVSDPVFTDGDLPSIRLAMDRPENTAGGETLLSWEDPTVKMDVAIEGLGPEAVALVNTDEPGRLHVHFVDLQGTSGEELHLDLRVLTGSDTPTPVDLYGRILDNRGREIGLVDARRTIETSLPTAYALEQNYPNPFNPATTLRYDMPEPGTATIVIYDITGQEVRRLLNERVNAGRHTVVWEGRDNGGRGVASGVYIYRLVVDGGRYTAAHRMMFLK